MNMPRFTAEATLYKTSGHYQTGRHAINSSMQMNGTIHSAVINVGEEVIIVEGEAPGAPWGLPWTGGLLIGGSGGGGGTPSGGGESGGGGGGGFSTGIGDPAVQIPCPPGLQPNPDYDRNICRACVKECDIAHPLEPCEGSNTWCNAINAEALRERRRCYEETCGWRCLYCI